MTISSQTLCFEARRKCGVGFIHTQLASSHANAPQKLASSPSTVGFITRNFHALISRQPSQTNRRGLYTLFLTSKSRCMQKNQLCRFSAYQTKRAVLIRSLRRRPYRMKPTAVGFISLTTVWMAYKLLKLLNYWSWGGIIAGEMVLFAVAIRSLENWIDISNNKYWQIPS